MPADTKLHDAEIVIDVDAARGLLHGQFPQWAELPLTPVLAFGTDHVMYRLGSEMALRFPRRPSAAATLSNEHRWLTRLAPLLSVHVPTPIAKGVPNTAYPWPWSVCAWVDGEPPVSAPPALARDLACFIRELQAVNASDGDGVGEHNHWRGAPLSHWEPTIRTRLDWIADVDNIAAITAAWDADRVASPWNGVPRWIHGDLSAGNLLERAGRLGGVLDWSCVGTGDPACELQVAWNLLDEETRPVFREALGVDDGTWIRGRAWGLAMGVLNLSYYRTRNPDFASVGQRAIDAALRDHESSRAP